MNRYLIRKSSYLASLRPQCTRIRGETVAIPLMVLRKSPGRMGRHDRIAHYETRTRPTPRRNDPPTTHQACAQCKRTCGAGWSQFIHNHSIGTWRHQGASGGQAGPTGRGSGADAGRRCSGSRIPRLKRPAELRAIPDRQVSRAVRSGHDRTDPPLQGTTFHQPGCCRLGERRRLTWLRRAPNGYLGTARAPKRYGRVWMASNRRSQQ